MYCKHCGKEIADDSKFCQHCGSQLEVHTTNQSLEGNKDYKKFYLSENVKFGFVGYGLWVVLNLYWLLTGGKSDEANQYFQPFAAFQEYYESYFSYYDKSEFIVYTIGLPLLIVGVFLLIKHYKQVILRESKDKIDTYKATHKKSLVRMGIWSLVCLVISLLDFWEDKTFDGVDLIWWIIIGSAIIGIISNWNELYSFIRLIMKKQS